LVCFNKQIKEEGGRVMKNLWEKDRKIIFRELLTTYMQEGYNRKEAKKLAAQETDEIMSGDMAFVNELLDNQDEQSS
tara:strand:+ start:363 stop:593 length:231 start_codon:yes stop_codon:yes gene_type:complete